jgi:uncharacterized protein YkwD
MSKKIFLTLFLLASLLGACDFMDATPTPSPSLVPTETALPATETPSVPPTETPTQTPMGTFTPTPTSIPPTASLTPLPPENAADCVNSGRFIADVTIPDESNVTAGAVVTKTWRIQNTGTCIWWYGYTVGHYTEFDFGATVDVPVPYTNPGETADLSVDLLVPSLPGLYRGNFVIQNPEGLPIELEGDSRLWVIFVAVDDGTGTAPTAVPTAATGDTAAATQAPVQTAACQYTPDDARINGVLEQINAYRAKSGLPAYTLNAQLSQAAQTHVGDMACNRFFTHTGTDGSTPETRVAAAGYVGTVSENVYGSYPAFTPQEATDWWRQDKTDPRHNLNLISQTYKEVGIGYAFYNNFGFYTVVFGTP